MNFPKPENGTVRWIDMIDPVYTLAQIAGVDPDRNILTSIMVLDHMLTIGYIDMDGIVRTATVRYILD